MSDYSILVCPVCGQQPWNGGTDMFGEIYCEEHGATEPLEVKVKPVGPITAPAEREKMPIGSYHWVLVRDGR